MKNPENPGESTRIPIREHAQNGSKSQLPRLVELKKSQQTAQGKKTGSRRSLGLGGKRAQTHEPVGL